MSFKTTYVLYGLLVGILLVFGIALYKYDDSGGPDASAYVLPSAHDKSNPLKDDDIDQIVIERTKPVEQKIVFVRDPASKRWSITEPKTMRGDRSAINNLVYQILSAVREDKFDKTTNLASLGLQPASETITLKKKDGREVWVKIGDVSPGEESSVVYVTSSDYPSTAMGVRKRQFDSVLKNINDFRDRDLLTSAESDIQSVKLVTEGKRDAVELEKTKDNRWRYKEPPYGEADEEGDGSTGTPVANKPPSGVRALLRELTNLRVDYTDDKKNDFVADGVSDFAKYNLDPAKARVLRIEIQRVEPKEGGDDKDEKKTSTVAVLVGVSKKADGGGDKYYARRADESSVVKVNSSAVEPLVKLVEEPSALRERTLVAFRNFQSPEALDIKHGSTVLEFRRPEAGKPWQMYRADAPSAVDDAAVQGLITLLSQKNLIKNWPDLKAKESDLGLDKPAAVVSLWVDAFAKDDKKDEKEAKKDEKKDKKSAKPKLKDPDKPTIRLTFGNVETDKTGQKLVNVKREAYGDTTLVKVPASVLERVNEGPLAYLDRRLTHFNDGSAPDHDVVRLTIHRDNSVLEVTRPKEGDPWKIVQPKDLAGRKADAGRVSELLGVLNNLHPNRLIAEKATDAELGKDFGLKSPSARAVVTVKRDGKEKNFEFLFGKELDDKQQEFAKQGDRDMVFTVEKNALSALFKEDVQDPQVFDFDVAKVKSVKLAGWKTLTGAPFLLEFERKDASQWVVKAPAGFNLDAGKVRQFLDGLARLRAERFVTRNATIKSVYDANLKSGAYVLNVELSIEGEKEPLKLTVINLDVPMDKQDEKLGNDRGFYATSNRLAGDLFQVRKNIFEGAMSKPTHFSP